MIIIIIEKTKQTKNITANEQTMTKLFYDKL